MAMPSTVLWSTPRMEGPAFGIPWLEVGLEPLASGVAVLVHLDHRRVSLRFRATISAAAVWTVRRLLTGARRRHKQIASRVLGPQIGWPLLTQWFCPDPSSRSYSH